MSEKQQFISDKMKNWVDGEEIDLYELFIVFLNHAKFIIAWLLACALVFGAVSFFLISPTYQSTAKMYIVSASKDSIVDLTDINIGTSLTADYEELIMSEPVFEDVIDRLALDMTAEELMEKVEISNPADTRVLYLTVTTTDPRLSRDIANTVMKVSMDYLPETMSTTRPNVAQWARMPKEKHAPSNTKNTLIGAILGLLIACAWLTIKFIRDDTIHTSEDMEAYFGIMPLASIPEAENVIHDDGHDNKKQLFGRKRGGR